MWNKLLLKNFPNIHEQEWSIFITNKYDQKVFTIGNKYTKDEFVYEKAFINSWQAFDILRARTSYLIMHTPQILLADHQFDPHYAEMFVQTGSFGLEKLMKRNTGESRIIEIMRTLFQILEILSRKYGHFRITQEMIKLTKEKSLLVWINEDFGSCYPQFPLANTNAIENQRIMINDFLSLFLKLGLEEQLEGFLKKANNEINCDFQKFKAIIENHYRLINCSKDTAGKIYHSPDFLKQRISQTKNQQEPKSVTQYRSIFPKTKTSKYITSSSIETVMTPRQKEWVCSKSKTWKEMGLKNIFEQETSIKRKLEEQQELDGENKLLNLFNTDENNNKIMLAKFIPSKFEQTISISSNSLNELHSQEEIIFEIKTEDKDFRETSNSLATTAVIGSVGSSGKVKFTGFDDQSASLTGSLNGVSKNKILFSSVGMKEKKHITSLKETFQVKASKIIEENSEEVITPHSFIKSDKEGEKNFELRLSEIERDIGGLLASENVEVHRHSNDFLELESEFNGILLG